MLKIILPLIAIGLLATVFLFTKERTLDGGLEFSRADFVALESGMTVTKPRFSGSNAEGDVYNFTAEVLHPDAPKPTKVAATSLSGDILFAGGSRVDLSAGDAEIDLKRHTVRLFSGANVIFSNGIRAQTDHIFAELETSAITTDGGVRATSPMGQIEAGNLKTEIIRNGEEEKRMLWFENGVKLTFTMTTPEENKAGTE